MTYPQQGPYGQRPPGRWQQPGHNTGPYRGYAQQQHAPWGRGPTPPEPPKKRRVGLILGLVGGGLVIAAGVVVLLLFTVVGRSAEDVMHTTTFALTTQDYDRLRGVACTPGRTDLGELAKPPDGVDYQVTPNGSVRQNGDTTTAPIGVLITGGAGGRPVYKEATGSLRLAKSGLDWCLAGVGPLRDSSDPGADPAARTQRARGVAQRLADAVNGGNRRAALATVCSGAGYIKPDITDALRGKERISSLRATRMSQDHVSFDITVTGGFGDRGSLSVSLDGGCVAEADLPVPDE